MKARVPKGTGFRLIDGVIVGAAALLAMKGLALMSALWPSASAPETERPAFARVLSHARTNYVPGDPTVTGSVPDKKEPAPAPAAEKKEALPEPEKQISPAERAILERLSERRDELQQRSREMEAREKLLENSEKRLDAKLESLKTGTEKTAAAEAAPTAAENTTLKSLVTMYETMKPKEAARVFERLPQDVLVPVVRGMNARKMAEVMAAMSPDSAEKLTVALARRQNGAAAPDKPQAAPLPAGELPAVALPARPRQR